MKVMGALSLRKSKIGVLNPKESENRFCVSLLNRSIQDLSDHGASNELKNPLWKWIDLSSKETQNPFSDSFGFRNPILINIGFIFLTKRTLNLSTYSQCIMA